MFQGEGFTIGIELFRERFLISFVKKSKIACYNRYNQFNLKYS